MANENLREFGPKFIDRCALGERQRRSFSYAILSDRISRGRRHHAGGWAGASTREGRFGLIIREEAFGTPGQFVSRSAGQWH